jgi:hypothetical protein
VELQLQSFLISALDGELQFIFVEQNLKTSHRRHVFSRRLNDIKARGPLATAATPGTKEYFSRAVTVIVTRILISFDRAS